MPQPTLFGVCGLAGSGKDTVADHLVAKYGYVKVSFADPLKRICQDVYRFTDEALWGPSEKRNEPDKRYPRPCPKCKGTAEVVQDDPLYPPMKGCPACDNKGTPGTVFLAPRHALQLLGTEWGRACYPSTWVDYALRTAAKLVEDGYFTTYSAQKGLRDRLEGDPVPTGVVIPDVRFENEIAAIKAAGGKVIRVRPPEQKDLQSWQMHPSEMEQAALKDNVFDYVIVNPKVSLAHLHGDIDRIIAL